MIGSDAKALGSMVIAPVRRRRAPADTPPVGREHDEPTPLAFPLADPRSRPTPNPAAGSSRLDA